MSRTSTMMTRIVPRPGAADERDRAARDQGALHALHVMPR